MYKTCINDDLVSVEKFCNITNDSLQRFPFWTQISIPETLILPKQKPNIEQINSVKVEVKILSRKIIRTPSGTNFEGKILTNRKIIVEGELLQTIEYTADVPEQSVHTAHFIVPFSAFIVLPEDSNLDINLSINSCVEDVFVKNFTPRRIFKNVTLLLQAVPEPLIECPQEC